MDDPTALLLLSGLTFFGGVSIAVLLVLDAIVGRMGVSRGLSSIATVYSSGDDDESAIRVGRFGDALSRLARDATPPRLRSQLRLRLDYAGNPPYWTVR